MHDFTPNLFQGALRGLEKENLRVDEAAKLSKITHEQALKTSANDSHYTLDFAESQLEVITHPHADFDGLFQELKQHYHYVHRHIAPQLLWPNSMPPHVSESEIQIAHFGASEADQTKALYRQGLIHRYGKMMQIICGIHYNFSLPDHFFEFYQKQHTPGLSLQAVRDQVYFKMIHFYLEHYWLLIYLFGASPIACENSLRAHTRAMHVLKPINKHTYLAPYATSLRQSDLGYHNPKNCELMVCFKDLDCYVETLERAINTPFAAYKDIPVTEQLNANYFQIENEFYAPIRPKQPLKKNERPLQALKTRGVAYLEVRVLDINPLLPLGVTQEQLAFIDLLLLSGLFHPQDFDASSCNHNTRFTENALLVCLQGRDPNLELQGKNSKILLSHWAKDIVHRLQVTADALDHPLYQQALTYASERIDNPALLPSAQITMHAHDYQSFMLNLAQAHQAFFLAQTK